MWRNRKNLISDSLRSNDLNGCVLEWLHKKSSYQGKIAAFGAWDVFPYVFNASQADLPVNAGYDQFTLVPDDTVVCTKQQALLNLTNMSRPPTGKEKFDINDEERWTLLPSGKVLTVDAYVFQYDATGTNSETYNPATGTWTSPGSTIEQLWDSCGGLCHGGKPSK